MKPIVLGLAALLAGAAGLAAAQDGPPPGGPMGAGRAMMRADANGDGVITRQEAIDEATKRFDRMDLNHDGKVDQAEMAQIGERMRGGGRGRGMGGDMPPPPPANNPPNAMAPQ